MWYNEYMETKLCTRCHQELPFPESFFRDPKGKNGYKAHCKKCDYKIPRSEEATGKAKEYRKTYKRTDTYRQREAKAARERMAERRKTDEAYREWKAQKDREYRQTPQGRARMARYKARRKAKELDGKLTGAQWAIILAAFNYECAYCGSAERITIDHFLPLYLGGKTEFGNIVPACYSCNSSKQHHHPESWCAPEVYRRVVEVLRILLTAQHSHN